MDAAALIRAWDAELFGIGGAVGIDLRSLGAPVAERDPNRPHYAASTIKLAVLGALLAGAPADGRSVPVHDSFASATGGSFRLLRSDDQDEHTWARVGGSAQLLELAERMIVDSGNLATDLVVEQLGFAEVTGFLRFAGLADQIVLNRLIGDAAAEASGLTNTVTAAGLGRLMAGIADGSLLGEPATAVALDLLVRQAHRRMIPAGLPAGTWVASKGGWIAGVKHDVALVRPELAAPYVLAVCTTVGLPDPEGEQLVARLSAVTWEHWTKWPES